MNRGDAELDVAGDPPEDGKTRLARLALASLLLTTSAVAEPLDALRKACDAGDASACETAAEGEYYPNPTIGAADFERACRGGKPTACVSRAAMGESGRAPLPLGEVAAFAKRGCDGNVAAGCFELGLMTLDGRGVPRDPVQAGVLFRRACDADVDFACTCVTNPHQCHVLNNMTAQEAGSPGLACAKRAINALGNQGVTPRDLYDAWKLARNGAPDRGADQGRAPIWRDILKAMVAKTFYDDDDHTAPGVAPGDILVGFDPTMQATKGETAIAAAPGNLFSLTVSILLFRDGKLSDPMFMPLSVDPFHHAHRELRPLLLWFRLKDFALCPEEGKPVRR